MRKFLFFITIFFLSLGMFVPSTAFGIGQVTKPIVISDALRNQERVATLTFSNSSDSEATYILSADGLVAEWTQFFLVEDFQFQNPVTEVKVPPGSFFDAKVKFKIPEDMPNGEYGGNIYISFSPNQGNGENQTEITISQRIGRPVSIRVTDKEIIKYDTSFIPMSYQVDSENPLMIRVVYRNEGNVAIKPIVDLKIFRNDKMVHNVIFPFPDDESAIKSGEEKVMSRDIEWQPRDEEQGNYKVEIASRVGEEHENKSKFGFVIGDIENAREEYKSLLASFIDYKSFNLFDLVILILLFAFISASGIFYMKRNAALSKKKNDIFPI